MYISRFSSPVCHWLDGLIQGVASNFNTGISTLAEMRNTDRTNQMNKEISADVNATNKAIADQNLAFQRENLDYQKALQQQIFEREDTSYQRTVDDMRAAGLSPLSMQSTNGAGEAIATEALHNDYQAQGYEYQKYDLSALQQLNEAINNAIDTTYRRDELNQRRKLNDAQTNLINAQAAEKWAQAGYAGNLSAAQLHKLMAETSGLNLSNEKELAYQPFWNSNARTENSILNSQLAGLGLDNLYKQLQNEIGKYIKADAERENTYNERYGINRGMTEKERLGAVGLTVGMQAVDGIKALGAAISADSSDYSVDSKGAQAVKELGKNDAGISVLLESYNRGFGTNYTVEDYRSNAEIRNKVNSFWNRAQ